MKANHYHVNQTDMDRSYGVTTFKIVPEASDARAFVKARVDNAKRYGMLVWSEPCHLRHCEADARLAREAVDRAFANDARRQREAAGSPPAPENGQGGVSGQEASESPATPCCAVDGCGHAVPDDHIVTPGHPRWCSECGDYCVAS